jgi:hypothetical protein
MLASFTSNLVPAYLLNSASERREVLFQSPSAAEVRQPTRRSSNRTSLATSGADSGGLLVSDGGVSAVIL